MSTIVFETLAPPSPPEPAIGDAALTLGGFGFARGLSAGAVGDGELWLQSASGGVTPPPVAFCIGDGALQLAATYGFGTGVLPPAQGDGILAATGRGSAARQVGDGAVVLTGFGSELRSPPTTGDDTVRLSARVKARTRLSSIQTALLHVNLMLAAAPRARWRGTRHLQSQASLGDTLGLILRELLTTSLALGERNHISAIAVEQLVDALLLGDAVNTELEAMSLIAEALALGATLDPLRIGTLVSGLMLGANVAETLTATLRWADELRLRAALQPGVLRLVVLTDRMNVAARTRASADVHVALRDHLGAVVRVHLDSGEYVAWVMNTQSKALSRYTNYPFNSFLPLAGTVYGATDTGLYRLGGDTDAGEPIHARIRQGMSAFGSQLKKSFPSMYLGYTASGDLRLSVVAADLRTGERIAHAYRLRARAADSVREGRVKVGAGLQSVYFDYVIENIDGADFGLDVIEFLPLRVDRRVRGNSSGRR
ncbi:hypothetical protein [Lysobacter sp. CA199]|uniref:hypothetical protein n=1 Tax=Lysobacter sp. CA199 TaxID=3455608 RepID=UPI003F8D2EDA